MHWFTRLTLLLAALGFLAFGLWFLVDPIGPLEKIDIVVSGAAAGVELRAFYAGLEIGLALWLAMAAFRIDWAVPALWLVLFANLGLGLARLVGAAVEGIWMGFFTGALVWEFGFALMAAVALALQRRQAGR